MIYRYDPKNKPNVNHSKYSKNIIIWLVISVTLIHFVSQYLTSQTLRATSKNNYQVLSTVKMFAGGLKTDKVPHFHKLPADPKSRVIIDVGACFGDEMIEAVKNGYIYYAFEPLPGNFQKMIYKFKLHNLADSFKVVTKSHYIMISFLNTWAGQINVRFLSKAPRLS